MPIRSSASRHLHRSQISNCLAVALGLSTIATPASASQDVHHLSVPSSAHAWITVDSDRSDQPAAVSQVMNCDDHGSGSLRAEIAAAIDGSTIDLSALTCSTITLESEIYIAQNDLRLVGPRADLLAIDGNSHSRNFRHAGAGTLQVENLTISNGYYVSTFGAIGGCIASFSGSVVLINSVVSDCILLGTGEHARGGGIFAASDLKMLGSTISGSLVSSATGTAKGGAAYVAGDFHAKYSSISNNAAYTPVYSSGIYSEAGGIFDFGGNVTIKSSTISANRSFFYTGLFVGSLSNHSAAISNSTISSNTAKFAVGGVFTRAPITLSNSTIAFNTSVNSFPGAGLRADDAPISLYSSIIAGNGGTQGDSDVAGFGSTTISGTDNLIATSTLPLPAGTTQSCPKLGPLARNGGDTLTHAPAHDSPAIDHGSAPSTLTNDQRLAPRLAGAQVDIGSVERQIGETDERLFISGFDGRCEQ